jgi:2,3-bisphosphoglycerate-independent phosphoglycerate mutase
VGRQFASARRAIETFRKEAPGVIDQDLPPFVIAANGKPVGPIVDNDSVIFFNFRGDRAIEISRAFEDDNLTEFDRSPRPKICYAGMMQYDGDLKIPKTFLVSPPSISRTMGELLCRAGVRQLAISETQKFGHVTYFFNGNRSGKFDERLEEYVEIPSDIVPFEQRPWMKCAEITDHVVKAIGENSSREARDQFRFIRLNYPNGDMVGHTGVYQATQIAVEAVDLCVGRLIEAVCAAKGILVLSADHGNADDMYEHDEKTGKVKTDPQTGKIKAKTSHSLNPVPVYVYAPSDAARIKLSDAKNLGISSLASTCLNLLGFNPPDDYDKSIVKLGND